MEKLRDILITDRSPADVAARNGKGTYNAEDLNRVLRACSWLAGRLEGYGYGVAGEYFPAALVHVTADPPMGGRAEGGVYYKGERVELEAVPASGFEFERWTEDGETVGVDLRYGFTADRDRDITAVFTAKGDIDYGVIGAGRIGLARIGKGGN